MQGKPSHVKRLNFGRSILGLRPVNGQRGLIVDQNVAGIPCTEREDFVRKWIETHEENAFVGPRDSCQLSPVLGSSLTKRVAGSPILGRRRKRVRGKDGSSSIRSNEHIFLAVRQNYPELYSASSQIESSSTGITASQTKQSELKSEDIKENDLDHRSTKDSMENSVMTSPVFRSSYSYRRKRKKADKFGNVVPSCIDTNTNSALSDNLNSTACSRETHEMPASEEIPLNQIFMYNTFTEYLQEQINKSPKIAKSPSVLRTPVSETKLSIDDSHEDSNDNIRERARIEAESSDDGDHKDHRSISNDSDKTVNDIIEDVDTQEPEPLSQTMQRLNVCSLPMLSNNTQASGISSSTYYSKADPAFNKLPSTQTSQRISQVISMSTASLEKKSSQTEVMISSSTSPSRSYSDPVAGINLLDSGKKRKRPRKGSLAAKLQSIINRQMSFVRIWRHQIKQAERDNTRVQSVTIFVKRCSMEYGRQFLEGLVVSDRYNLLEESEANDSQCSNSCSHKSITIMIIPDIVGKIQVGSKTVVKIYPPWEPIDERKTILNVMYITVISDTKNFDITKYKSIDFPKRQRVIKEFDCSCMIADRILSSCSQRCKNEKPEVMKELFDL